MTGKENGRGSHAPRLRRPRQGGIVVFGKILVTVFVLAVVTGVAAAQVVEDGLISYWTFDESSVTGSAVKDVWGKNDATTAGDAQIAAGKVNEGVKLDGDGDYVDCGKDSSLNLGVKDFSIEYWAKFGPQAAKGFAVIKMKPAADYTGFHSSIAPNGAIGFDVQSHNANNSFRVDTKAVFSDDKWHHIVCVADRSEASADAALSIYVDGAEEELSVRTSNGDLKASIDNDNNFYIGTLFDAARGFVNAAIDEVRVYGKALSAKEVLQNFDARGTAAVDSADKLALTWSGIKILR